MIGWLQGTLASNNPPRVLVNVNGVGYEVQCPAVSVCATLQPVGETISLFTHGMVRDDTPLLYGFLSERSRDLFRACLTASGVGPKLALSLLDQCDVDTIVSAVQQEEPTRLSQAKGIGQRVAQKLVVELKPKLKHWSVSPTLTSGHAGSTLQAGHDPAHQDAVDALLGLGYRLPQVERAVADVLADTDLQTTNHLRDPATLIRQALQRLAQRSNPRS